jgi:hypothetical protein
LNWTTPTQALKKRQLSKLGYAFKIVHSGIDGVKAMGSKGNGFISLRLAILLKAMSSG